MSEITPLSKKDLLKDFSDLELATALAERNAIAHQDWHRLKNNRLARARQQLTSALVFLLKNNPQESLEQLKLSLGWLDGSVVAPPCPDRQRLQNK